MKIRDLKELLNKFDDELEVSSIFKSDFNENVSIKVELGDK